MHSFHCHFRPHHTLDYGLLALESGLHGVEILYCEPYLSKEEYRSYMDQIQVLQKSGARLSVHAPILDMNLGSLNKDIREVSLKQVRSSFLLARALGATIVVVHPIGGVLALPPGEWSKQDYKPDWREGFLDTVHGYVVEALKGLAEEFPHIQIGVENLVFPHELYRSPKQMQELLQRIDRDTVGLTLDVGHASTCGYSVQPYMELKSKLLHVHFSDNHGVVDEHLPIGQGTIDFSECMKLLGEIPYGGIITLEFTLPDPKQFAGLLEKLKGVKE